MNENIERERNRVRLANERTFLSWIRTSIAIMAFGFVVQKFALFLKQAAIFTGQEPSGGESPLISAVAGTGLVALGTLLVLLAFLRFRRVERQISTDEVLSSSRLDAWVAGIIFLLGLLLVAYLILSFPSR